MPNLILDPLFHDPFDGLDDSCRTDECSCPTVFHFLGISGDYVHFAEGCWLAMDIMNLRDLDMADAYSSASSQSGLMPRRFIFEDQRSVDLFLQSDEPGLELVRELVTAARAVSAPQVLTLSEIFSIASLTGVVWGSSPAGSSFESLHWHKVHGANDDRTVSPLYVDDRFQHEYSKGDGLPALVSELMRSAQRSRALLRWPNTLDRERRTVHFADWLPENLLIVPVDPYLPAYVSGARGSFTRVEERRELWGNRSHVVDCYEPLRVRSSFSGMRQCLVPNPSPLPRTNVPFDVMGASSQELRC